MAFTLGALRTAAMAAAIVLYATVASPQAVKEPQAHDHQDHGEVVAPAQGNAAAMTGTARDVMARMAVLDERIQALASDMNMLVGELKIETMAALLTALVERQSLMRDGMERMHGEMMGRMMERRMPATPAEEDQGAMCAPSR